MADNKIKKMSKAASLVFCGLGYLAGFLVAAAVVLLLRDRPVMEIVALADLAATVVIFAFSLLSDNSSFYDPYWSVAPLLIILYLAFSRGPLSAREIMVIILVLAWSMRLTWNWIRRWRGFQDEDFRYADFRKSSGRLYWPLSFLGFHLFPTVIVFLGLLPLFSVFRQETNPFNIADVLALVVTAGAILIEAVTDRQLWQFKKQSQNKGRLLEKGLWRLSRHPNYFGEVLFWCGLFIFSVASGLFQLWMLAGPAAVIILFIFISVPLADRRMKIGRPFYKERMQSVSGLLPLPPQQLKPGEILIPLSKRPLDIIILAYLLFNLLFVSYIISIEQIAIPNPVSLNPVNFTYPPWPPRIFVDLVHWWEGNFDPLLLARPVWYKATIWIDVLLFGPFSFIAAYAFIRRRNWIRLPAIIYAAIMFTNVTIILSEEIWGPHAAANPLLPVLANASWFIFPFIIIARMWKSDHPFSQRKSEK
jgi:steroid 5-alpha reductase family enzyme